MSDYDYDLFVIGGGSGGVRCARMSGSFGARVAICEDKYWGGTCVNVGCVPKKLFVYSSHFADVVEDAPGYGWTFNEPTFDWPSLIANKNREIERLNGIYTNLLERFGVDVIDGRGHVESPHSVRVGDRVYTAKNILIATGGRPRVPNVPGKELAITSDEAFFLEELPERMVIVGTGYIGMEFAAIFHGLGVQVTLMCRNPLPLRGFDIDVRKHIMQEMMAAGLATLPNANFSGIEQDGDQLIAHCGDGRKIPTDCVFLATGRDPNVRGMGLGEVDIDLNEQGGIRIDDHFCSSVSSIYALGDVVGHKALTPVALEEGMVLARNLFGGQDLRMSYHDIATAVFTNPTIATVGHTEEEARRLFDDVEIYRSSFRPMFHTMTGRQTKSMMKLVVDRTTDRVVGCHMVGPDAGESIQGFAVALKCHATKAQFDATVGIHPTAAEEFVTMRTPVAE